MNKKRHECISKYCEGFGLEIGALHQPFKSENSTSILLDRMSTKELKEWYAGDEREKSIKQVHLVAKRLPYSFIDDGAFSFVFSSHVLEHMPNPGLALREWMRITNVGGVVYCIIPNKNMTFDRQRETTPVSALMDAFHGAEPDAPLGQYFDHFRNSEQAHNKSDSEIRDLWTIQDSIHVYTFTPETTRSFVSIIAKELGAKLEFFNSEGEEIYFALRKL